MVVIQSQLVIMLRVAGQVQSQLGQQLMKPKEERLREEFPAVKEAWEQYRIILQLAMKDD